MELEILYLVSMPIGNLKDISERGRETLESVPTIVVEEYRNGKKILEQMGIDLTNKKILELNEHVERPGKLSTKNFHRKKKSYPKLPQGHSSTDPFNQFLGDLLASPSAAVISDAGAPILADPGFRLLEEIHRLNIYVTHIPGGSSLISGLLLSGFSTESFYYVGFLPQNRFERERALSKIKSIPELLAIMETPYRLSSLLLSLRKVFHAQTPVAITFALTTDSEEVFRGKLKEAVTKYASEKNGSGKYGSGKYGSEKNRRPFVLFINNRH